MTTHPVCRSNTTHMNRLYSTFRCWMGSFVKPLENQWEFRVNKHGRLGRSNRDSLWPIFDRGKNDTTIMSVMSVWLSGAPWQLFCLLCLKCSSVFPSTSFLIVYASYSTGHIVICPRGKITHPTISCQDNQTCGISHSKALQTSFLVDQISSRAAHGRNISYLYVKSSHHIWSILKIVRNGTTISLKIPNTASCLSHSRSPLVELAVVANNQEPCDCFITSNFVKAGWFSCSLNLCGSSGSILKHGGVETHS